MTLQQSRFTRTGGVSCVPHDGTLNNTSSHKPLVYTACNVEGRGQDMFVDMSFFEVDSAYCGQFEQVYGDIVRKALDADGCLSSDLVRLSEVNRYCWVERWQTRDAHQRYNEFLFGDLIPGLPEELSERVTRLENRDAEGYSIDENAVNL